MLNIKKESKEKHLLNPSILTMLVMVVLIGMGEKMGERFLPLYLIALGGTTFAVSFLNGMDNFLSALYSFPGGFLSDKIGYKKALFVFNILAMIGYSIVIIISQWWAVLVGAFFFISWTAISLPAIMSMVAKLVGKDRRTMGVSLHSLVRRIPMALGPIVGGAFIQIYGIKSGIRISFGIALGLAIVATLLELFFVEEPPKTTTKPVRFRDSLKNIRHELQILLVSDILVRFAEQIPYAFLAIWVINYDGHLAYSFAQLSIANVSFYSSVNLATWGVAHTLISPIQFGYLTAIEMATALIIYIPVAYFADKYQKKPFVVITFGFFTLFPVVLYFSQTFWMFVIAFIIRGLKEFGEPTRKALIMDLAPENAKASTFGTYYLIRDVIVSIAAFTSAFLWNVDPAVNFFVAAGFGVIGTTFFAIFGKNAPKVVEQKKGVETT